MKQINFFSKIIVPFVLLFVFALINNNTSAQCSVNAGADTFVYIGYPSMACANLTATPTGTPPFTYLWSNGATTQTINVCDTIAANYVVTVTDSTGCTASDNVMVTVVDVRCGPHNNKVAVCHVPPGDPGNAHNICVSKNAVSAHLAHGDYLGICVPPVIPCSINLGNDTAVCSSQVPFMVDAGAGYVSYLWSDSSTAQTFSVTVSGTYWVQVTDSTNCTAMDTITVIVHPSPAAAAGNDTTIIPPGCASLFGFAAGGTPPYSYLWSTGDTTQAILVCPVIITTYIFTVIDSNGCSSVDSVTVTTPLPCSVSLGPDTAICSGEAPFILNAGAGYASYLWSDSSVTQSISVSVTGTYWIQVTDSANCIASDTVNIIVYPSPAANAGDDTTVFEPDCASLFGSATGGTPPYSFLWSTGDTTQAIVVCDTVGGTFIYTLTVVDSNGCSSVDTVIVTVIPLAMINLDPNPNSENARITFMVPKAGAASIELYNMAGNKIAVLFSSYVNENVHYGINFSAGDLPSGIYLVRLVAENGTTANTKMVLLR